MATPLLQTKLYIPPVRPEWVPRPRLIERLNAGLDRELTFISAPAGFGNWQASGSLITGFIAKEVVVGTMSQIYVGGEEAEEEASRKRMEEMQAIERERQAEIYQRMQKRKKEEQTMLFLTVGILLAVSVIALFYFWLF